MTADARKLLKGAYHALRSYQCGNASPDLAKSLADQIEAALGSLEYVSLRAEVLEEAAKECEAQTVRTVHIDSEKEGRERDFAVFNLGTHCCAKAIRSLKGTPISPVPAKEPE